MRDSARFGVIAGLAIFAVAVAAATIQSTVRTESSSSAGPAGSGGGGEGAAAPPQVGPAPGEVVQIPFLEELLTVLLVLVVLAVLVYLYTYWRSAFKTLLVFAAVMGVLAVLVSVLGSPGAPSPGSLVGSGAEWALGGGGGNESDPTQHPSLPAVLLLVVLVAALLGTLVAYRNTSSPDDETTTDEQREPDIDTTDVGAAAGRAADRLEAEESVGNEVYRAWREMTALLDIPDPETSTPQDFASAAVSAGMERDDVRELTRLFEDVRYGEADPSVERERQAIDIFRRIEDQYTEEEES